ncbi:hypothetical protein TB2_019108 [Malus domestica]
MALTHFHNSQPPHWRAHLNLPLVQAARSIFPNQQPYPLLCALSHSSHLSKGFRSHEIASRSLEEAASRKKGP